MNDLNKNLIDVLSDVLSVSNMGNAFICEAALPMPWGLKFEAEQKSMFQLVRRGTCFLKTKSMSEPIRLMQGDIVLLAKCEGHVLTHEKNGEAEDFREVLKKLQSRSLEFNLGREYIDLLCGVYYFRNFERNPILAQLPEFIHLSAHEVQNNVKLQSLIQLLTLESTEGDIGVSRVRTKLVDVMFVYIVRAWLTQRKDTSGWLVALKDSGIGKAIGLMHNRPEEKWTIENLAEMVGMSRSSFAQKFTALVGETPLSYLTRWRMSLSMKLLTESNDKLASVAASVGYDSETAFSKVFKKANDISPGNYRIKQRAMS